MFNCFQNHFVFLPEIVMSILQFFYFIKMAYFFLVGSNDFCTFAAFLYCADYAIVCVEVLFADECWGIMV